jgi:DNA gyrase subunit A
MESVITVPIEEEMKQSYLDYAMSVIVGRALPDLRDGLKPVHRRILYSMYQLGLYPDKPYKKSARIVGETLGKFHPHGDTAVYDALVRMAQDFSMRYPLIDGQGNFGSVDGDSPAAMRYTEARLSKISMELLKDIEKDTVDFRPNFDESLLEPEVLPARFPNLIVNGASGIAVGMATNIPPHNLKEVCEAIKFLVDNPDASVEEIMNFVKGPDFPTGGQVINASALKDIYSTGRGTIILRAKFHLEETKKKKSIVITELPYQVNKAELIKKIAELVKEKKIEGISDLRDESDKEGMRVVIELKKDATPEVVINQLLKFTSLQTNFGVNMIALVNGEPKLLSLKDYLSEFINFRREVIIRRTSHELRKAEEKLHTLEGILIAIKNIDETVEIVKTSASAKEATDRLMERFSLTQLQAKAVLDMKLQKLTKLETQKIEEEIEALKKDIAYYRLVLESEEEQKKIIKKDMDELIQTFGDERRTEILEEKAEISEEELVEEEEVVLFLTVKGLLFKVPAKNYHSKTLNRTGSLEIKLKSEDYVKEVLVASSRDTIIAFSNHGRAYWFKAYEVSDRARGQSIKNVVRSLSPGEEITKILPVESLKEAEKTILFVTKHGYAKRTSLSEFSNPRSRGISAIVLEEKDKLVCVELVDEKDNVLVVTKQGRAIRFPVADIREMKRNARGVKVMNLEDDSVVSAVVVNKDVRYLLMITENGFGKRVSIEEFPLQRRGGKGVIAIKLSPKTGRLVDAVALKGGEDVIFVSSKGRVIKINSEEIPLYHRHTRGVRIQKLSADEKVISVSVMKND